MSYDETTQEIKFTVDVTNKIFSKVDYFSKTFILIVTYSQNRTRFEKNTNYSLLYMNRNLLYADDK